MSLLSFQDVYFREGGKTHLEGVSFALEPGERLVAFGRSGSGKHFLLQLAAGILMPTKGRIEPPAPGGEALPVGWIPNEGGLLNNLTLVENVALPLVYHGLLERSRAEQAARDVLAGWGLKNEGERRPAAVGISALRMVQLARAKLVRPAVYLLADPLEDVDAATARLVRRVLGELLSGEGRGCIVTTGSLASYLDWGTRFLFLRGATLSIFKGKESLLSSADAEVREFLE